VDTWATLESHSIFFDHIRKMGSGNHTLEFKLMSSNENANIQKFGKYFYDNIILMAPTAKKLPADMSISSLLDFVDAQHNIMIFLNNESRKISRDIANEFGVDLEEQGFSVQGGEPAKNTATTAFSSQGVAWSQNLFAPLERVMTPLSRPVLFEDGIGMVLDSFTNNQHVFPVLSGDVGTYSKNIDSNGDSSVSISSGNQLTLVAGYQTHYNQRISMVGSIKMCSNSAMLANRDKTQGETLESSPNYQLCSELVEWNMQERGVLKVENVRHRKVGDDFGEKTPENYKRLVDIEYMIDIYHKVNGQWVPFVSDDVQFQFIMLDPYYQDALTQTDKSSATYSYKLKTPWRLGIFNFRIDYKRYGLSYIDNRMEVSVIQLRHDEFPRFETIGYPYFLTVFVLMAGSFLFVISFAYSDFSGVKGVKSD